MIIMALARIKRRPALYEGRSMALAGVVTGYVGLVLSLIVSVLASFVLGFIQAAVQGL